MYYYFRNSNGFKAFLGFFVNAVLFTQLAEIKNKFFPSEER